MTTGYAARVAGLWWAWPTCCVRLATLAAGDWMVNLWRDLPGPVWVKILLVVAAVAEPGPFGEWALYGGTKLYRWARPAITRAWHRYRAHRQQLETETAR